MKLRELLDTIREDIGRATLAAPAEFAVVAAQMSEITVVAESYIPDVDVIDGDSHDLRVEASVAHGIFLVKLTGAVEPPLSPDSDLHRALARAQAPRLGYIGYRTRHREVAIVLSPTRLLQ
jgi:hypothetical protein